MTKKHFTHIIALLDRSGSMLRVQNDTIGGFNTFVSEQKKVPGEATLTLVQFSDDCETTFSDVPLAHVAPLTTETYKPSGWTALNDALAKTINAVGSKLAAKPEAERPSKIVVLIMTDGEENKSKEFKGTVGLNKLSSMVLHQKEKYAWEFVFIGANIDAFTAANTYGIDRSHAINYSQDAFGQANAFKSMSKGMAALRTSSYYGAAAPAAFFENEISTNTVSHNVLDTSDISATIDKYITKETATTPTQNESDKPTV